MVTALHIGNAPCSWGAIEFEDNAARIIGYAQMLDELAATGYTGTELGDWGFMPTDPARLRGELARRKLAMIGAFVPVRLRDRAAHGPGEAQAVRTAQLLAAVSTPSAPVPPVIVLADDSGVEPVRQQNAGRITPELALPNADWPVFAAGAAQIARAVRAATGLHTVFHPHCAGWVETPAEIARFLNLTDPDVIGLCFDTGHFTYGGGDAAAGLARFATRIGHVHFKDCSPTVAAEARTSEWDYSTAVGHGVFCELGDGAVDFPAVLRLLREQQYSGWIVVEQDVLPGMGTPKESAQRNRNYLASLGL
ncbi:MAG: TIM barrel protein [Thermomicrobiales bacterium]